MADSYWSGLGVAAGTAISTANVNTAGNSDASTHGHTVTYSPSGAPTATYARPAAPGGPGLSITGIAGDISRLDLAQVAARGGACQELYTPSGAPTTADQNAIAVRSAAAAAGYVTHSVGNTIQFRNAAATPVVVPNGTTPVLVNGHVYQIDLVVDLNAGTPSTTNGRIIGRVKDLTSATWNTTGEFFVDTGYTVDIGTAQITTFRVGKTSSTAVQPQAYFAGLRWGERTAVNTGTNAATARMNFINEVSPAAVPTGYKEVRLFKPS